MKGSCVKFVVILNLIISNTANIFAQCTEQVASWAFDWDDNVMFMPTQVMLYEKGSNNHKLMTTGDFAIYRDKIGIEGKYKDYEIRTTNEHNSFKYFRDSEDNSVNYFLNDVKNAVTSTDYQWKGPAWDEFIYALNNKKSAKWTYIITARGHSSETIYQSLEYLKEQGVIKYLPSVENIHAVSHPKYEHLGTSTTNKKTMVMSDILDNIETCDFSDNNQNLIYDQNGNVQKPLHVWKYSDDDFKNYMMAKEKLAEKISSGKWSNIKISLLFTGA